MLNDSKRTTWIVEIEDTEGQGIDVSGLGQTDEDVEGQGVKFNGLMRFVRRADEDDNEG